MSDSLDKNPNKMIGKRIGPYTITSELARGGMGMIYLAKEESLDRVVVLKILPFNVSGDDSFKDRFIQEAKSAARMDHPNIVNIYSAGEWEGYLFIAMQFIEGKTLRDLLEEVEIMDYRDALAICREILRALGFAHKKGFIHRDIKPDNIMIDSHGHVKVMDFGLAKNFTSGAGMTQSGLYLGTPEYSSPEQCETTNLDARTDLYSAGVVLYEMLTGCVPHAAETPLALFKKIASEEPVPVRVLNSNVPRTVEALLNKLLAKKADARYQTAETALADIERILASERYIGSTISLTKTSAKDQETMALGAKTVAASGWPTQSIQKTDRMKWLIMLVALMFLTTTTYVIYEVYKSRSSSNRKGTGPGTEGDPDEPKEVKNSKEFIIAIAPIEVSHRYNEPTENLYDDFSDLTRILRTRIADRFKADEMFGKEEGKYKLKLLPLEDIAREYNKMMEEGSVSGSHSEFAYKAAKNRKADLYMAPMIWLYNDGDSDSLRVETSIQAIQPEQWDKYLTSDEYIVVQNATFDWGSPDWSSFRLNESGNRTEAYIKEMHNIKTQFANDVSGQLFESLSTCIEDREKSVRASGLGAGKVSAGTFVRVDPVIKDIVNHSTIEHLNQDFSDLMELARNYLPKSRPFGNEKAGIFPMSPRIKEQTENSDSRHLESKQIPQYGG